MIANVVPWTAGASPHRGDPPPPPPPAAELDHGGDANGDGYAELFVGHLTDGPPGGSFSGQATTFSGSATGLTPASAKLWSQDTPGVAGTADFKDGFGFAGAWGDFNGDGYDDLAISHAGETVDGIEGAGAFTVLNGSTRGLTARGSQEWSLATPGLDGDPAYHDLFAAAFAVGDFNGDGIDDLAVTHQPEWGYGPYEVNDGAVTTILGSSNGLSAATSRRWVPGADGLPAPPVSPSGCGASALSADLDLDGFDDVVLGCDAQGGVGALVVLRGSPTGTTAAGSVAWDETTPGLDGLGGYGLAAGDIDGDGDSDLVLEGNGVIVVPSAPGALSPSGAQHVTPASLGLHELSGFNASRLTVGDFDGDGFDDLAVTAEQVTTYENVVAVVRGSASGLTGDGAHVVHRDGGTGTWFGWDLTAGDFDGDGRDDLAASDVSSSDPDVETQYEAGSITVIYGFATGLDETNQATWTEDTPGILGEVKGEDWFGWALA